MNSRRKFILDCSVFVAALTAAPVSSFGLPVVLPSGQVELENIGHQEFFGLMGTIFRVRLSSGSKVDLKLLKAPLVPPTPVIPGRQSPGDAANEKFSLIFNGPKHALLTSAIHQFEHDQLGWFEMYIGQIGKMDEDVRYEAGFNRAVAVANSIKNLI